MAKITAVVLAAGLSRRMGQPKMLLPWDKTSVLGQVVSILCEAVTDGPADFEAKKRMAKADFEIIVVTGGVKELHFD